MLGQQLFKSLRSKGLSAPPRTRITHHFSDALVNGDGAGIGFHREPVSDIAVRHAVSIAVELQSQIFVNKRLDGVAVIVGNDGQRPEGFRLGSDLPAAPVFRGAIAGWLLLPAIDALAG